MSHYFCNFKTIKVQETGAIENLPEKAWSGRRPAKQAVEGVRERAVHEPPLGPGDEPVCCTSAATAHLSNVLLHTFLNGSLQIKWHSIIRVLFSYKYSILKKGLYPQKTRS